MFSLIDKVEENEINKSYSEDAYLILPTLVAVCDGGTSKSNHRVLNEYDSDAMWLSNTFLKCLKKAEEQRKDNDVRKLLNHAMDFTLEEFNARGIKKDELQKYELPNSTLILAMQHFDNPNKVTLVNVADGAIIYKENGGIKILTGSPILQEIEKQRKDKLITAFATGKSLNRADFIPAMQTDVNNANTPTGYAVLDLSCDWINHPDIRIVEIEQSPEDCLFLGTDGVTRIFDLYETYDYKVFYQKALKEGLKSLIQEMRTLEKRDMNTIKYPRLKASDDVCGIICRHSLD